MAKVPNGAKMAVFGPNILIFWEGTKLLVPAHQKIPRPWPLGPEVNFCFGIAIFDSGASTTIPRATIFQLDPPQKNPISKVQVIFWGSSRILAIFGEWRVRRATTLTFGPRSTKL